MPTKSCIGVYTIYIRFNLGFNFFGWQFVYYKFNLLKGFGVLLF